MGHHTPHHSRIRIRSRRDALCAGCLTAFGLTLTDLFAGRSRAAGAPSSPARSCILLWLDGGPSHLDTFDPKPDAPSEIRGPFQTIPTSISGIRFSELLPETARIADRLAVIRSMTSPLGEHGLANQYLLTGYKPSPVLQYPGMGSVVTHLHRDRGEQQVLPPYVAIPQFRFGGAGFLGSSCEAFATGGDPSKPDFRVRDLDLFPGLTEARIHRRRDYLSGIDAAQSILESTELAPDSRFEQAWRLMSSPEARSAFDLTQESDDIRARYGPRMFGQSCLLARRLVERGVPFVSVNDSGWDTHDELELQLKLGYTGARTGVGLVPTFDQGYSSLLVDLEERGLLSETLVIAMGEFGRTPRLNTRGGRDHWPRVFSAVLAGGGVRGGQIIGSSDRIGESPSDRPVTPSDLTRSIYELLGIDPDHELQTPDGRPVPVNQGGKPIPELTTA